MKFKIIIGIVLILFFLPLINADILFIGFRSVDIENKITNINDFPDYVFLTFGEGPMCDIKIVEEGIILEKYKFCKGIIYAIPKEKFDFENFPGSQTWTGTKNLTGVEEYLLETNAIKVIENIGYYRTVYYTSTIKSIQNEYVIDLNQLKTQPDKTIIERDYIKILPYIGISFVALLIIILIILKKRK